MECYENGLLTKEDTGGIELTFGNEVAVIAMIEKIGKREGIGDLLAEGVKRAAVKIGHGTEHLKPYPDCEFQESFGTSQGRAIHTASFFPKGCAMTGYS
jgi:aldehyde:ferredoxin oxidoreductase